MFPQAGNAVAGAVDVKPPAGESKVVFLVRLLNAIDEGTHSLDGLKDRIAEDRERPSTRTIHRYLGILSDAGFPWYFDRKRNAYRFADGYSLKRLDLSSGEIFGLVALRSLSATIGGTIGASIAEVTEKLVGTAGRAAQARAGVAPPLAFRLSQTQLDEKGERDFALLSAAERNTRSVSFEYTDKDGKRSDRTIDPYGFIINAGRVYCVAYDHGRKDMRTFAIDSIGNPVVLAKTFVKPADFNVERYAGESISGLMHSGEPTLVRVRFAPRVAKAAIAARVVADTQVRRRKDGAAEIAYRVSDTEELIRWVLGWGTQAKVLSPPGARKRIAALAKEIAKQYQK